MDIHSSIATDAAETSARAFANGLAEAPRASDPMADGLVHRLEDAQSIVIGKQVEGFEPDWLDSARRLVRDAAAGRLGPVKFLAFDFAHGGETGRPSDERSARFVGEVATLILRAPVVSVAYVRDYVSGPDLELALACNMLVCEQGARFSFAGDPVVSVATYALLAQKIGFVRAERLMENEQVLDAAQMSELLLVKETTAAGSGMSGLEQFLTRSVRRHNSTYGIYRAQRIATPLITDFFGEISPN